MTTLDQVPVSQRPVEPRPTATVSPRPGRHRSRSFRSDIEGLRAVAILAVIGYHAGLPFAAGGYVGVDVFFVISGFLITRQLVRELENRGRIHFARFYAARVRRLLPLSLVVLAVTVAVGVLVLDPLRAKSLALDALAAAAYGLNWRLAELGSDYLTATAAPSALQHYWSLGLEEQFYLAWPLLLTVTAGTAGRVGDVSTLRRRLSGLVLAAVVVSLAVSVVMTARDQPWAYFGLHARAWELAAGAMVAVAAERLGRLGGGRAATLTWSGLTMIVLSIAAYDGTTPFPGLAAVVPVIGAVLVIGAGCRQPVGGASVLLSRPTMQLVGSLSYGWYLWHWPVLLLAPALTGYELSPRARVLASLLALGLAALTHRWVERPVRSASWPVRLPWRGIGVGLVASGAVAATVVAVVTALPDPTGRGTQVQVAQLSSRVTPERVVDAAVASALSAGPVPANLSPPLTAVQAVRSLPEPQRSSCHADFRVTTARRMCAYGDASATRTIVLFGDSHALQWFPGLEAVASKRGYRLLNVTKSSCTPMSLTIWNQTLRRAYKECDVWRRDAIARIRAVRPRLVVLTTLTGVAAHGMYGDSAGFDTAWAAGTARTVRALRSTGTRVAVLSDSVLPGRAVPQCLAEHLEDASACSFYRAGGVEPLARRNAQASAARAAGAEVVDPVPWLCGARQCPTVVGNLLVYRDEQHLSTSYSAWLAPVLQRALRL